MSETKSIAQELLPYADRLLGTLNPPLIRQVEITRPTAEVIQGFLSLSDLTSVVADILDELGYDTAIPAQTLRPLAPGQRIVGPAVTARQTVTRFHVVRRQRTARRRYRPNHANATRRCVRG
ncbi:hypothetical protein [Candidatus Symbiopectobacterium sp. 'North America']|uniref:hypothetical protein n=1 Tax=Candidatus Symbiopectobacterium sp. 'North America' TaxID=2794574 RepID=UPI0018C93BA0|nr:hypothetical protein [Candidatus Symbiopectobacterium sp. 'North America']